MIRINFLTHTEPKIVNRPEAPRVTPGVALLLTAVCIIIVILAFLLMRSFLEERHDDETGVPVGKYRNSPILLSQTCCVLSPPSPRSNPFDIVR